MGILCSCCKQTEMTDAWTYLGVSIVVVRGCDLLNIASTVQWGCGGVRPVGSGREIQTQLLFRLFSVATASIPGGVEAPLSRHVVHSHMYKSRPPSTMSDIVPRKVRSWAASRSLRRTWGSRRSGTGRGSRR
ncbi:hypothetical protein HBI56_180260 [Parastagonospora nodorum]|uniref:Uncharacterized protein n=1 Tax=Phaeosphaeria nodorum (strain SN15 / ATCC MYA-4574 / FGSC 10173) TaxID=321614 RepID=A0A7U2F995_PHANO|nr:hypothetical protein HBH56_185690 [Parastagonospora nodorum]QRD01081.1 hypothetical protein JI435_416190 [Parastagonospora nodorum SN15]KAH3962177.1 hypothetical protein HBH52_226150 [Parastagonospora nodorum]KAH3992038.1 hypothetical protein HBI10_221880 [Parastagonospora nodorum]KAH4148801.1 hypothetical protein HBH44_203930 [Parastagonospora nodorum]